MIVSSLIVADCFPIDRFRRSSAVRILFQDLIIHLLRIFPFFPHKGDARQPEHQLRNKFISGQITLDTVPLLAVFIENERRRCPNRVKAMETGGVLFNVDRNGNEVLVDK